MKLWSKLRKEEKRTNDFQYYVSAILNLDVKQLDEAITDWRSELEGKSERIQKMTATMCPVVDKVERLQVRAAG